MGDNLKKNAKWCFSSLLNKTKLYVRNVNFNFTKTLSINQKKI